jgi:hypothetical protein
MKLVGSGGQQVAHYLYDASGATNGSANTAGLILPVRPSCSYLRVQNLGSTAIIVEVGCARANATLTNGQVSSISITNAGFNFTKPPLVRFLGGGNQLGGGNVMSPSGSAINTSYLGLGLPGGSSPSKPARAHAVLTGGAVSSIVIDDPGAGYVIAPYVQLINSDLDPYGAALPSATSGFILEPTGSSLVTGQTFVEWNGTTCPTEAVSVISTGTSIAYSAKWMD